jgi:hypothetical protein
MAVRETEKYLPAGGAEGLGQCDVDGKYALVSYLSSPVPQGLDIDYVVFATDGAAADTYEWTFKEIPGGLSTLSTTDIGVARYRPKQVGLLEVRVQVLLAGNVLAKHKLTQIVIQPTGHLFTKLDSILAAMIGDPDVTLEVMHAFKPYILETTRPDSAAVPAAFLAAMVYAQVNRVGPAQRSTDLHTAGDCLNDSSATATDGPYLQRLGVCQMLPERLAMVAPRPGAPASPSSYIAWDDLPAVESARDAKSKTIRAAYCALPSKAKIELYNLLRFPKANVSMCAALLTRLKNRPQRWPALAAADMLTEANEGVLATLATEYESGPVAANYVQPTGAGRKIAALTYKPFVYASLEDPVAISGVVSTAGSPLEGARVQLRQYVARISDAEGVSCHFDASVTSAPLATLPADGDFGILEAREPPAGDDSVWLKVDTPLGAGWINARSGEKWYARILTDFVIGGAATTDSLGRFNCRVARRHQYRVHVVSKDHFDGESDFFIPPRNDLSVSMEAVAGAVPEAAILELLHYFKNFEYVDESHDVGQYPYPIKGLESPTHPLTVVESDEKVRYNDCTTFTEALLVKSWLEQGPATFGWNWDKHKSWMIITENASERYSQIDAAKASGMVLEPVLLEPGLSPSDGVPEPWTLVQGFEHPAEGEKERKDDGWGKGHSYIIVDRMPAAGADRGLDKLLILESNFVHGMKGPGFWEIGDLDRVPGYSPGRDWWNSDTVPTWQAVKKHHPYLKMARLKVYDLNWVR